MASNSMVNQKKGTMISVVTRLIVLMLSMKSAMAGIMAKGLSLPTYCCAVTKLLMLGHMKVSITAASGT